MPSPSSKERPALHRRLLFALLRVGLLLAVVYFLLPYVGLRLSRMERNPVPLTGSELAASRAAPPAAAAAIAEDRPRNVVVFVADGLGFAHLAAARTALHGLGGEAAWDRFTATGWHRTHSAEGLLIDSAASATALATGIPTTPYSVGVDSTGAEIPNLFERATQAGYRTGVVTDSYVWDATPAAFTVHAADRDDSESILRQLASSSLEVLVGELEDLGEDGNLEWEPTIEILEQRFRVYGPDPAGADEFLALAPDGPPAAAIFEEDQIGDLESTPPLPPFVRAALERLSAHDEPFLLLVESEEADSASHRSDFGRLLRGMEAMEAALDIVLDFAEADGETLVVFTSDHETGGLALGAGDRTNSSLRALWPTRNHTAVPVPLLALGPSAERFAGIHATWEVGRALHALIGREEKPAAAPAEPAS